MNAERLALARRAVSARGWCWLPGMRIVYAARPTKAFGRVTTGMIDRLDCDPFIPDLDDEVTRLALAAVARGWYGEPRLGIEWNDDDPENSGRFIPR